MTTTNYTSAIDNTTTAGFRLWGSELSTNLNTVGLVQTADTGQINWGTVNLPGTGASAGYEIWRFADSTLYLKLEYGVGSSAGYVQMWVTVGTGSNGSGTLTGQLSTRNIWTYGQATNSTSATYTTYISRTAGHLAIFFKSLGASSSGGTTPLGVLVVGKTVDGTGATTTTGFAVFRINTTGSTPALQSVRIIATAATYTETTKFALVPGEPTSSLDAAGNYQCYMAYMTVPDALPFMWINAVNYSDVPRGTTFSVAQVGATARTYLSLGNINGFSGSNVNNHTAALYSWAMLYE